MYPTRDAYDVTKFVRGVGQLRDCPLGGLSILQFHTVDFQAAFLIFLPHQCIDETKKPAPSGPRTKSNGID